MAEQTMVERVANDLFQRFRIEECEPPRVSWEEHAVHGVLHEFYREAARAAIEAMREPTEAMVEAVQIEVDIWPEDKPKPSPNCVEFVSRDEALGIWRAGIDVALKD